MKKFVIFFFLFSIPYVIVFENKNSIKQARDIAFKEISAEDSSIDSVAFFKNFDSLVKSYKITAISFLNGRSGVNHFLPWNRVVLIDIKSKGFLIDKLIREFTHAEQFSRNFFRYSREALASIFSSLWSSIFERAKYKKEVDSLISERKSSKFLAYWWIAYSSEEYSNTNSYEYEAHKIIEPKIKKIFGRKEKIGSY